MTAAAVLCSACYDNALLAGCCLVLSYSSSSRRSGGRLAASNGVVAVAIRYRSGSNTSSLHASLLPGLACQAPLSFLIYVPIGSAAVAAVCSQHLDLRHNTRLAAEPAQPHAD
jgi:hypothetical protein